MSDAKALAHTDSASEPLVHAPVSARRPGRWHKYLLFSLGIAIGYYGLAYWRAPESSKQAHRDTILGAGLPELIWDKVTVCHVTLCE